MIYISYCRKSRLQEPEELTRQEQLVKEYCRKKGYKLHKLFSEVGSSVDPNRPQYKLMLEYLTEHTGITIIVADYDRIGRDTLLLSLFKQLCKEHRHLVELVNGTIYSYDNYTDIFTQEILSSVSAYIYQQTKAKMYRGMIQARKEGKRIGAKPYGYDIVNKRLVIDPTKADTVKRVFKLVAEGISTAEVARLLKQDNITTNTGRFFDTRAVRLLIKNEGYTGKKNDNVYPPIISKELFLLANQQLRSIPNCGNKRVYPLSGKIICKHCGTSLIIGYKADRGYCIINSCNSSRSVRGDHSNKCSCQGAKYSIVEDIVKLDCLAYLEIQLSKLYDQLREDKELLSAHDAELQAVKAGVSDNKEKLSKLNNLYLMNNISQAELTEKSAEIKNKIDLLELKQQRLEGYSLFKISQEIQDRIVKLEELKDDADINELVVLVDYVLYYKNGAGIQVITVFRE